LDCNSAEGVKIPEGMSKTKLVNFAMANKARRKIINFLANGDRNIEDVAGIVRKSILDFHFNILQQANLIELEDENVKLSEYGRNFLKSKKEKGVEIIDFSQAKQVEIVEVKQLLTCIADPSKFRVIGNMTPPLGEILKVLEPIFPSGNYSEKIGGLITQKGEIITTIYGSGKVSMRMIKDEGEAREVLEELRSIINGAIKKGVAPAPKEKVRVELMEVYKYLPQTNCGKCGEQGCYSFAIKLMAGQVTLEKCTSLKEPDYATNQERLQFLAEYI